MAAGADFPFVAAHRDRAAALRSISLTEASYLWLVPDGLLFVLARPHTTHAFLKAILSLRVHKSICRDDLRPLARQIRETLYWIKILRRKRGIRYPQGLPAGARTAA